MGRRKVEYVCVLCGYTTNKKSRYLNHKARTTPCIKKPVTKAANTIIINTNENENKNIEELKLSLKQYKRDYQILLEENEKKEKRNKIIIELNNKENERKVEVMQTNITNLININKTLNVKINQLSESINLNMTLNNYFVINNYGKEDISYIDMDKILNDYKTLAQMLAKQIQLKHFSEHKENHNVHIYRTCVKTYKNGIWTDHYPDIEKGKKRVQLFIVNELIKKGVINIDEFKKAENIKFESKKEKLYKKDKKKLLRNIPLPCMFNPVEAKVRLTEIEQEKKNLPENEWTNIIKKYTKEMKTAEKQLEVKNELIQNLDKVIQNKVIKANIVGFKNYV